MMDSIPEEENVFAPDFSGDWADYCNPELKSPDEVNDCFTEQFSRRDFWEDHFNVKVLQQILDYKYNRSRKSEYVAKKDHYQMKWRCKVICKVCSSELKGYDAFISHDNGKGHKKRKLEYVSDYLPSASIKSALRGLEQPRGYFNLGSLEHELDYSTKHVMGVQFVYSEGTPDDSELRYTCQLCSVKNLDSNQMLNHLEDYGAHRELYMRVKFQVPNTKILTSQNYMAVVRKEGRINHPIHKFSVQRFVVTNLRKQNIKLESSETDKIIEPFQQLYQHHFQHEVQPMCVQQLASVSTSADGNPHVLDECLHSLFLLHTAYSDSISQDTSKQTVICTAIQCVMKKIIAYCYGNEMVDELEELVKIWDYFEKYVDSQKKAAALLAQSQP